MVLNVLLKAAAFANSFLIVQIVAYRYLLVVKDENIFSPCDTANTNYIDEYFDLSKVSFRNLENGSVYINGETTLIRDLGSKDNSVSIQIFKKNRDTWISTVYNMNREDMCRHIYDKTELWFPYTKDIPENDRTCPFPVNKVFKFDVVADMEVELPDPRLAGEYKMQLLVGFAELNEMLCANVFTEIYRI